MSNKRNMPVTPRDWMIAAYLLVTDNGSLALRLADYPETTIRSHGGEILRSEGVEHAYKLMEPFAPVNTPIKLETIARVRLLRKLVKDPSITVIREAFKYAEKLRKRQQAQQSAEYAPEMATLLPETVEALKSLDLRIPILQQQPPEPVQAKPEPPKIPAPIPEPEPTPPQPTREEIDHQVIEDQMRRFMSHYQRPTSEKLQ